MNRKQLDEFYLWFNKYTDTFFSEDKVINTNIQFKIDHTKRVVKKIKEISESIQLSEEDMMIAEIIALFHDIGRFEQFSKYRTFRDAITEDHAELGIKIISEYNLFEGLSENEKSIILNSIRNHNKYQIPKEETEKCILFCKLIRDADKLDILDSLVCFYENPEKFKDNILEDYIKSSDYQSCIVSELMKGSSLSYNVVKTTTDIKLIRLAWVYDIYFSYSVQIYKKNGYMDRIFKVLPDTEEIRRLYDFMRRYLDSRIDSDGVVHGLN